MITPAPLILLFIGLAAGLPQGRAPGWGRSGTGREYMERTETDGNETGYAQPKGPSPPPPTRPDPTPPPCPGGQGYLIDALSTMRPGGDVPPKGYQPPKCPPPATKTTTTTTTPAPTPPPCPGGGGYVIAALSAQQTGEVDPARYQPPACPFPITTTTQSPSPPSCPEPGGSIPAPPPGVKGYAQPACPPSTTTTTTTTTEAPCAMTTTKAPCPHIITPTPCPCAQTTTVPPCHQLTTTLPPVITSPHSKGYPQPHPNALQRSSRVSSSLVGPSPPAGASSSYIPDPQPAGLSSVTAKRRGRMQFYQTFQQRGDPAVLSPPQLTSVQSSYSGGARRDSPWPSNVQSDQPQAQKQVGISITGRHLRQEVVDKVLLPSDQELRRSLNRLLGSSIHKEHHAQLGPGRKPSTFRASPASQLAFSVPTVRRHHQVQDYQMEEEEVKANPEEFRLVDLSFNAPVSG